MCRVGKRGADTPARSLPASQMLSAFADTACPERSRRQCPCGTFLFRTYSKFHPLTSTTGLAAPNSLAR
jgi:hypothetical protein